MDETLLALLAKDFPSAEAVSTEIINLHAILCLPKGTEYFFSDPHGEAEAFGHLLNTASGVIRDKIEGLFARSVPLAQREELSLLITQPETVLPGRAGQPGFEDWCRIAIYQTVQVCRQLASKYTRSKVRKMMPARFAYILDELLHADTEENKEEYYAAIIDSITATGIAVGFLTELCALVRRCAVDRLHILGDIFDRGPHADEIIEQLMTFPDVDVQWGNHDIHWLGAYLGSPVCAASVVRLGISYNNFDLLEDGYGINLRALSMFAAQVYRHDPCTVFRPHLLDQNTYDPVDEALAAKMHKAIAVIQFKLEGQLYRRHPEYGMAERSLLERVDYRAGTLCTDGRTVPLQDRLFPTVDPADPLALTPEEQALMDTLTLSFTHSRALRRHFRFLFSHGGMYKICNGNLLYHGCIPMTADGAFDTVTLDGRRLSGRAYLDAVDRKLHDAFFGAPGSPAREDALDYIWYLWCGPRSPLFGKSKLSTFERYFTGDEALWQETLDPYYTFIEKRETCEKILAEFGLPPAGSHIVNGHVPVRAGEHPRKGDGLLYIIDGGISKAYHGRTGLGGYTLIFNSHHLALAEHRPFEEIRQNPAASAPKVQIVEPMPRRLRVADTDTGALLRGQIARLEELLAAYRGGLLPERG